VVSERTPVLTPRLQHTMSHAAELALARGHEYLGTEHVILALIDDPNGIAGGVLHRLGYADAVRAEVTRIIESDGYKTPSRRVKHMGSRDIPER
jgi:ATP-dependent Clp protease ATP-binding subunit ClpA